MIVEERSSFDSKDRKIISMLSNNPEISQEEIADKVELSQPAVCMRIKRLKEQGFLFSQCGLNPYKSGLYLGKIEVYANSQKDVLKSFKNCPFFLNGFVTSGKNNLCILMIGEDLSSLQSLIDHNIKENPAVERVENSIIISASKQIIYPIDLMVKKTSRSPCGSYCGTCSCYKSGDCLGCPSTTSYKGNIWK